MDDLPIQSGIYTLFLRVTYPRMLEVGRLGQFKIPTGIFAYQGSAQGSGGLKARLGRHLQGNGKLHWHIDYLRVNSEVVGYAYIKNKIMDNDSPPLECTWNQALLGLSGATIPVPGFGASDCKTGCQAHLVHISHDITLDTRLRKNLQELLASVFLEYSDDKKGTSLERDLFNS